MQSQAVRISHCPFLNGRYCLRSHREKERGGSMSWRFLPKTGLNLAHKLMLLVFVTTVEKLILARDEITPVVGLHPLVHSLFATTLPASVWYRKTECIKESQSLASSPRVWPWICIETTWGRSVSWHSAVSGHFASCPVGEEYWRINN